MCTRTSEQKSLEWLAYQGYRTSRTLGAWSILQHCRCPAKTHLPRRPWRPHTSSWLSLDPQRQGQTRGPIRKGDGIDYPPTEGLLRSRKTHLRGTIGHKQLVRLSPQGSSGMSVPSAHTGRIQLSFFWSGSLKGGGQKAGSVMGCGVTEGTLGTYPARGYRKTLAMAQSWDKQGPLRGPEDHQLSWERKKTEGRQS